MWDPCETVATGSCRVVRIAVRLLKIKRLGNHQQVQSTAVAQLVGLLCRFGAT